MVDCIQAVMFLISFLNLYVTLFLFFFILGFFDVVMRSEKSVDLLVVMDGVAVVVVAGVVAAAGALFRSDSLMRPLSPKIRSIA